MVGLGQVKARKEQDEKEFIQLGVDCDACGISSVQKMAGEDPDKTNRTLRQQQQVGRGHLRRAFESVWLCDPTTVIEY